ncbi:MAG TPA: PqqD family peptide modification chaperone [Steroidobacteraceae bacterium]|nr:PqqD family peptide modification chaperone [Steroidobacteraceae bacterium]
MRTKSATRRPKLRLASAHRLLQPQAGGGPVLVTRSGRVRLNATAAAILAFCDGTATRAEIVARVAGTADPALASDVRAFLEAARRSGWVVER